MQEIKLRVGDIKQYLFCPRVIYFHHVCPVPRKYTGKMELGQEEHLELERLEKRRRLKRYNLEEGERIFHTGLYSERLGLEGKLDLHIVQKNYIYPVEIKHTHGTPYLNHKYQVIAYAMLLEEYYHKPIRCGFLYFTTTEVIYEIEITPNARKYVLEIMAKIRKIIQNENMPSPPRKSRRCIDCEFRRWCNDMR
ncbi:CRISPR-associated protein Cas4 [Desulfitibacter alkalitolerans]|uniref:CRISPR-associated protein Cas4 n=1 Tax=Desulfitibacter alkalitolerans TaxID=264641 RepID=UPI001FA76FB9|nr:CRISPR-associated protein Cas4 [Desulfitibacter alkalitolerans]